MNELSVERLIAVTLITLLFGYGGLFISYSRSISTSINDNGQNKPTKLEIKQTKTNADAYNYAALSTDY